MKFLCVYFIALQVFGLVSSQLPDHRNGAPADLEDFICAISEE